MVLMQTVFIVAVNKAFDFLKRKCVSAKCRGWPGKHYQPLEACDRYTHKPHERTRLKRKEQAGVIASLKHPCLGHL